jgi:hypothetical protein
VARRKNLFKTLTKDTFVIQASDVSIPACAAEIFTADFQSLKIKTPDRALAALAILAEQNSIISRDMLEEALSIRFKGNVLEKALAVVDKAI